MSNAKFVIVALLTLVVATTYFVYKPNENPLNEINSWVKSLLDEN